MFSFDLGEEIRSVFDKFLVLELYLVFISSNFMEVVHIELNEDDFTCRTKEDILECLKYLGNTIS